MERRSERAGCGGQARLLNRQLSLAIVAGLDDVAVVSEAIEQRGGHLGVAEDTRPFAEGEIGGDDDRGAFVEPADEMEEELAAGLGEGQIAEFIEDDEVHAGEVIGEPTLASEKYARRTFAIVSTISIPTSASKNHGSQCAPALPGSRLEADHPENGVPIARLNTSGWG